MAMTMVLGLTPLQRISTSWTSDTYTPESTDWNHNATGKNHSRMIRATTMIAASRMGFIMIVY